MVGTARAEGDHGGARVAGARRPARRTLVVLALGLAATIGLVGWLGRDDGGIEGSEGSEGDPGGGVPEVMAPPLGPAADFPPSDDHLTAEAAEAAEADGAAAAGELAETATFGAGVEEIADLVIVYPSRDGPVVLTRDGSTEPGIEIAVGFEQARKPLLTGENVTWAIGPDDLETAYLVSTRHEVIAIDGDGTVGYVNDERRPVNVGISSFGSWGPGVDVLADTAVLAVAGRGILLAPRTGGTYEVTGVGPVPVSDLTAVAASVGATLYRSCSEQLECAHHLEVGSAPAEPVDIELDGDEALSLAPDGDWLLIAEPDGPSRLVQLTGTGTSPDFADWGRVGAVGWSDSGDAVVVVAGGSMRVVLPDRHMAIPVEVTVPPTGGSVLVFGP